MDAAFGKPRDPRLYPDLHLADHPETEAAEDKDGGWIISFVDIITLLLTLFVLLLALNHSSRREPAHDTATPAPSPVTTVARDTPLPHTLPAPAAKPMPSLAIPQDIKDKVDVVATPTDVNLVIKDEVLFDEGSAKLKASGASVLEGIARILGQSDYPVSVEGHTDDIPIHSAQFPSNWELSTSRATTVTRYFIDHRIAAGRLRAIGYADTRPVADNTTAAGRTRNRRVSLVIHVNEPVGEPQASAVTSGGDGGRNLQLSAKN